MGILGIYASSMQGNTPMALWLDASDASTFTFSSGTRVSQWNDKSGNGRNFVQATSANQPDRNATQNGKSAVIMKSSGGTTYYMTNSSYNWSSQAFTVILVNKFNTAAYTTGLSRNSAGAITLGTDPSNYISLSRIGQATTASNLVQSGASVITWKSSNGVSGGSVTTTVYQNGTQGSSDLTISISGAGDKATIGATQDGTTDPYGNSGYMCELRVYAAALSNSERSAIESQLITKWGL